MSRKGSANGAEQGAREWEVGGRNVFYLAGGKRDNEKKKK